MQQYKYKYADMCQRAKSGTALPDDINQEAEAKFASLRCAELDTKIKEIRARWLHGELTVYDSRGICIAEADVSYGMLLRHRVCEIPILDRIHVPLVVVFKRSELNHMIQMGKDRHNEDHQQ
jgi:hypothetical protein